MITRENTLLLPLKYMSHDSWLGGMLTETSDGVHECQGHRRGRKMMNRVRDEDAREYRSLRESARYLPGKTLFIGYLFTHFGHYIIESLPYLRDVCDSYDNFLAYSIGPPLSSSDSFWAKTMNVFSINIDQIEFCWKPVFAKSLTCFDQRMGFFNLGNPPLSLIDDYLRLGKSLVRDDCSTFRALNRVYISKSNYEPSGGTYLGESLIEARLLDEGYFILKPEDHSLETQLGIICAASELVFCEGSAIHSLFLTGVTNKRIAVIARRPYLASMFRSQLDGQIARYEYIYSHRMEIATCNDRPWTGISLLGLNSLQEKLLKAGFISRLKPISKREFSDHFAKISARSAALGSIDLSAILHEVIA